MLRCREITRLVSESLDRDLPWRQRWQVRLHLMMCRFCAGFARQLRLLRRAVREHPERLAPVDDPADLRLSESARRRIRAALREKGLL